MSPFRKTGSRTRFSTAWHATIGDPTLADAILDRLVHNAHRLTLMGDSMRKAAAKAAPLDPGSAA